MAAARNRIGTYFLLGALGGFLAVSFQPWLPLETLLLFPGMSLKRLLAAFFDAALVGALADWFAVTALFRDPLGLRLPHTNILAKNKDAIAEAVPRFLSGFVSDERIRDELGRFDFSARLESLLASGGPREGLHDFLRLRISAFLASYTEGSEARAEPLRGFLGRLCDFVAETIDPGPAFAELLRWARRESFDERLIAGIAGILRTEIGKNRPRLAASITPIVKRNAGWKGIFIGTGTMEELLRGIEEELSAIASDRKHELKAFLLSSMERYAGTLAGEIADASGERAKFAEAAREVLRDPGFRRGLADFAADLLGRLGMDLGAEESRFVEGMERIEDGMAAQLGRDEGLRQRVNAGMAALVSTFVARVHLVESLSQYMAGLLKATDSRVFVDKIEDSVWNDLQYIRVNGAVVGGLVGLVLSVFSVFFPSS